MSHDDVLRVMHKLYAIIEGKSIKKKSVRLFVGDTNIASDLRAPFSSSLGKITRDTTLYLEVIGHGSSGCVLKALFVPTLTFLAIKSFKF